MMISAAKLLACCAFLTLALFTVGCSDHVMSTSWVGTQVGTETRQVKDESAVTTIGNAYLAGNTTGCFADGEAAPAPPWDGSNFPWGTRLAAGSPSPGRCEFPFDPGTWYFQFFSGKCANAGQQSLQAGYMATSGDGHIDVTVCNMPLTSAPAADGHFAINGLFPSTVTVAVPGLTTTYGMPQLRVHNSSLTLVTTVNASSVSVDGSSATFPFPTGLVGGTYLFGVKNREANGQFKLVDFTYYIVGSNPALSSAFGVDAVDITKKQDVCNPRTGVCTTTTSSWATPILTQYYSNKVTNWVSGGTSITVGSEPVAVRVYGTYSQTVGAGNGQYRLIGPSNAIVVNAGSNSVSIVSFQNSNTLANISVGTQPMAVALNSGASMAYVANYGSNTLSEINLSTKTVSRTATGLPGAQSVAMDPGGSYVWVGGTNNLYKVSLSTFAVVGTYPVSGTVTSLAASTAQNELVYTLVQNCCSGSSTYSANELKLSNMSQPGVYSQTSASAYAPYTMNGTLPSAASLPQATAISTQFGNGMAASSTPTGFVIYDIVSHQQIMTGTTPTPVRGIASDPQHKTVYFTVPDSNQYIAVPLPQL